MERVDLTLRKQMLSYLKSDAFDLSAIFPLFLKLLT